MRYHQDSRKARNTSEVLLEVELSERAKLNPVLLTFKNEALELLYLRK